MTLNERCTHISVDIRDMFVFSLTEVYPPEISTGSRIMRPEPASTVRSFTRALIQISFSLDAYLLTKTEIQYIKSTAQLVVILLRNMITITKHSGGGGEKRGGICYHAKIYLLVVTIISKSTFINSYLNINVTVEILNFESILNPHCFRKTEIEQKGTDFFAYKYGAWSKNGHQFNTKGWRT